MQELRTSSSASEVSLWGTTFALVSAAIFGWYGPRFEADMGRPLGDVIAATSPVRTLALMANYGASGRSAYLVYLSLSCFVPVTGSLLLLALYDACTRSQRRGPMSRTLTAVAVLPAVCDLTENTLHALLAALYPRQASFWAELAYGATLAKLASSLVALLTLVVLAARWLRRRHARHATSAS